MFFYLVRGSDPKNSELLAFKDFTFHQNPSETLHSRYSFHRTALISVLFGYPYRTTGTQYVGPARKIIKNAKLFMFKDLHFIRLRTHAKHFIQDTVQASKTLQSRYSTTELSLSVFFSGTGTEIPVLGTRVWPKNSKLLTFKNVMIYQNPSKSLHSIYSTAELS